VLTGWRWVPIVEGCAKSLQTPCATGLLKAGVPDDSFIRGS
jgi:hypothetical protein